MGASRRAFLKQTSAAAAVGLLAQIPGKQLWATAPIELLPEPDEALMRELALTAIEAARAAGADFADIRLGLARTVSFKCSSRASQGGQPTMRWPSLTLTAGYGVRAIVDGAWGFASGRELTTDAVAATARTAVAGARLNRPRRPRTLALAPRPSVESGIWATPMEQDPLTVPLGEQADLALAALAELTPLPAISAADLTFHWRRPTTVFAATDGTVLLQRLATALPSSILHARVGRHIWSGASAQVASLRIGGYGYEAIGAATLAAEVRQAAERAIARARAARAPMSVEVGRYDLIFGPEAAAKLVTQVAGALDLERALGYMANGVGTSFAAPPDDMLGKYRLGAEHVTIRADRTQPHGAATVGWDEEGVKPEDYTLVDSGTLVDYHTNRQTAAELEGWYRSRGMPVRAHGCARRTGAERPRIMLPNLTLEPGPGSTTLDDLIADTRRGFYVESFYGGSQDQQALNAQFGTAYGQVRQITNGKLGDGMGDFGFQFITPEFWKSVDGLGGVASAVSTAVLTDRSALFNSLQPFPHSTVRTVPLRARDVNVLSTGRTA